MRIFGQRRMIALLVVSLTVGASQRTWGGLRQQASQAEGQQTPAEPARPEIQGTIRSAVTLVDVPVLVLDTSGRPVSGLTEASFRISDDGQTQEVANFDAEARPLALAVVVDTTDADAVAQARRSAEVIANQIVGATGIAGVFVAGAEGRQILPFTADRNLLANTLRALQAGPEGPDITMPLGLAIVRLRHLAQDRTRAVLVITKSSPKGGKFSSAIIEATMNDAIPVFRVYPNTPRKAPPPNPVGRETNGPGVGSSRQQPTVPEVGSLDPFPRPSGTDASFNLGRVLGPVADKLRSRHIDYIYETGGLDLKATNDGDFDRKLTQVGDALRGMYHLYYRPTDLTPEPRIHSIQVRVRAAHSPAKVTFRRTYVAVRS